MSYMKHHYHELLSSARCVADMTDALPGELHDDQDYMYDHGDELVDPNPELLDWSDLERYDDFGAPMDADTILANDPAYLAWLDERDRETAEYLSDPEHERDFERECGMENDNRLDALRCGDFDQQ